MGTDYYMVSKKTGEKVYVGRGLICDDLDDFKKDIVKVQNLCYMEDSCGWDILSTKPAELSVEDIGKIIRIVLQHIDMVSLFERRHLLAFFLSRYNDEWDNWELKNGYELDSDESEG